MPFDTNYSPFIHKSKIFFLRYFVIHSTFYTFVPPIKKNKPMDIENTKVQMRKGILEFCILQIISRGEVYASTMLTELTSAQIMVVEGTLYPLLTRLKNAGFLDYKWVESVSGPPRKYYVLTEKGTTFLAELHGTWDDLHASVSQIIHPQLPQA
jgi:PadR family transcriptional regulator PadR